MTTDRLLNAAKAAWLMRYQTDARAVVVWDELGNSIIEAERELVATQVTPLEVSEGAAAIQVCVVTGARVWVQWMDDGQVVEAQWLRESKSLAVSPPTPEAEKQP